MPANDEVGGLKSRLLVAFSDQRESDGAKAFARHLRELLLSLDESTRDKCVARLGEVRQARTALEKDRVIDSLAPGDPSRRALVEHSLSVLSFLVDALVSDKIPADDHRNWSDDLTILGWLDANSQPVFDSLLHKLTNTCLPPTFAERRPDKEPANSVGTLPTLPRYTLQPLQTADIQEAATSAREWLDEKTDGLKEHSDLAAMPDQMSYPSFDAVAEIRDTTTPAFIEDGARQAVPSGGELDVEFSTSDILTRLADPHTSRAARQQLVCEAGVRRFSQTERETLLELLWQYILDHRDSNDCDELVAVGSAIRKFAAIMPMDRMEDLAVLIEPGHNTAPAIELELELAKMAYRNHEVYPPSEPHQQSRLTAELWRLAQDYLNPRFLLREKHSAVASLAIEALIAMRSSVAEIAWRAALECPYRWFGEMVTDHVASLRSCWLGRNDSAVAWLDELRGRVMKENP